LPHDPGHGPRNAVDPHGCDNDDHDLDTGRRALMSRRHQASRRRTYGRRQHELHQRPDLLETEPIGLAERPGDQRAIAVLVPVRSQRGASAAYELAD
jgi:hypothetical protein